MSGKAFGAPGIEPRWTSSAKDAVGSAYSASSNVWYTLSHGILNEVYYPTIDKPQIRDFQFLISDGKSFVHEEKRHLVKSKIQAIASHALGFEVVNSDPDGRYEIAKHIISNPHQSCVLIRTRLKGDEDFLKGLKIYALLAPHLEVGGWGNNGRVVDISGHKILTAEKKGTWLAMGASVPFSKCSCGYVGKSDGWNDLQNFAMDWEFDEAPNGNIALTGELDLSGKKEFVVALAFGDSLHNAATVLFQSLEIPFKDHEERFVEQWGRADRHVIPLEKFSRDRGHLYHMSHSLLTVHEDKRYQGAMIASLSVPWGEVQGDENLGGYHLVWTRDLYHSATGLLAAGTTETPRRTLTYLAATQCATGGFYQNFWIDGEPNWKGIQLDETAFPVILAMRLHKSGNLRYFDPYPMILRAAAYLIDRAPCTQQERWEENSGYSPSTLAAVIAALTCAACMADERKDHETACFIQEFADFLESRLEDWTVTTQGTLVPGIPRHYIRIQPVDPKDPRPSEDPNTGILQLKNQPPGAQAAFAAKDVVDGGFLELVRYGIRKPGDRLIEDSLAVVDAVLKVETPFGPCWRRYNHDGYGQKKDGGPYEGYGVGRAWPILTGERAHYELASGRDVKKYLGAIEGFSKATGLLPEQIWDEKDKPEAGQFFGRPSDSAMPLMWAHAEYIKLLRSVKDGEVFDFIPEVAERYLKRKGMKPIEVWNFNRQVTRMKPGALLRVMAQAPFKLVWTVNEWAAKKESASRFTALGIHYVDVSISPDQKAPVRFTFYWPDAGKWEGKDYFVLAAS